MKAVVYNKYGAPEVLSVQELPKPSPGDREVLVRISATAVNTADVRLRKADPWAVRLFFGLTRPKHKVLGGVFSGRVEEVGRGVTRFRVGDEVFGSTDLTMGAYAQYRTFPEGGSLTVKPGHLSHEEAAVIPFGGTTALYFLKKAKIRPGQRVLVYGASGAVGSAALQLAKHFDAEVTAVSSGKNAELVKSLGADHVLDYTRPDFTTTIGTYDVIFDAVNKLPVAWAVRNLKSDGTLILAAAGGAEMLQGKLKTLFGRQKVFMGMIRENRADIDFLKTLLESGALKPVIDRTYTLEQIADAHAYVDLGHKRGNVAITV